MKIWIIILLVIGVIYAMIMLALYLYYYSQLADCRLEPNIWCWTDWVCPLVQGLEHRTCPSQFVYGCTPGVENGPDFCTNNPNSIPCYCRADSEGNLPAACICQYASSTNGFGEIGPGSAAYALCNDQTIPVTPAPTE